jgi:triacylglycerol lipase
MATPNAALRKARAEPDIRFVLHPEQDQAYVHFENSAAHPFIARADTMGRRNAWWLADAALLAYWDPDGAVPRFASAGLTAELVFENEVQCYVAWTQDFVIVSFRGTESDDWRDLFDDACFRLVPHGPGTRVHAGFKDAFERVWPRVHDRLQSLAPSRSVWFTGHSLGAALATLAAERFAATSGVCTIGCPRVGDAAFASAFDARFEGRSVRYVNDADIVTHVPPRLPLLPYKHTGGLRHIAPDGAIGNAAPALAHYFAQIFGDTRHVLEVVNGLRSGALLRAPDFLLDHMPRAYTVDIWNDYADHGD